MLEVISQSPVPVATIAVGKAMSCGATLLAAGTKGMRYAAPNSTILVHDVSGFTGGKAEDMVNMVEHLKKLKNKMFGIFDKFIDKPSG